MRSFLVEIDEFVAAIGQRAGGMEAVAVVSGDGHKEGEAFARHREGDGTTIALIQRAKAGEHLGFALIHHGGGDRFGGGVLVSVSFGGDADDDSHPKGSHQRQSHIREKIGHKSTSFGIIVP